MQEKDDLNPKVFAFVFQERFRKGALPTNVLVGRENGASEVQTFFDGGGQAFGLDPPPRKGTANQTMLQRFVGKKA